MKSLLRVDYKSRYGDGDFGDKEALVRIEVERSDDPRDELLYDIFQGDRELPVLGVSRRESGQGLGAPGRISYCLYKRTEAELECELAGHVYETLCGMTNKDMVFVTGHDKFYFEDGNGRGQTKRIVSKGVDRRSKDYPPSFESRQDFIKALIADFKDFEKLRK